MQNRPIDPTVSRRYIAQVRRLPTYRPIALTLPFLVVIALLSACGPPKQKPERGLYEEANAEFESGNFNVASMHYDELLEQYPFSDLAEIARLRVAHSYYLNGSYEKAIAAFSDFERLHPTSPMLPFVEYSIGMSYLDQRRTRDRDKSATENALLQFGRVEDRYPDSLYGRLAEYRTQQCRQFLASHELYVADFYVRSKQTEAALRRYRYILDEFPDSDAAIIAAERLGVPAPMPPQTSRAPAAPPVRTAVVDGAADDTATASAE